MAFFTGINLNYSNIKYGVQAKSLCVYFSVIFSFYITNIKSALLLFKNDCTVKIKYTKTNYLIVKRPSVKIFTFKLDQQIG